MNIFYRISNSKFFDFYSVKDELVRLLGRCMLTTTIFPSLVFPEKGIIYFDL